MLPLHTIVRSFIFFFSVLILTSCGNKSRTDKEIIRALNESIIESNQRISNSIKELIFSFEEKIKDPALTERAQVWRPKIIRIQQLSDDIYSYIENIKSDLNSKNNFSKTLFDKLVEFKKDILLVDPKIDHQFQQLVFVFTKAIDSSFVNQKKLFQSYFDNGSTSSSVAMLNKLQNNVRVIEEKVITFCYEQSSGIILGPCVIDFPIAIINSTVVQPAEKVELTAGIGSFYTNYKIEVFVYGKPVAIKDDGAAVYKFKAESKPGKYYIPVRISYTNLDGKQVEVQKEIEYTVANIQKQE